MYEEKMNELLGVLRDKSLKTGERSWAITQWIISMHKLVRQEVK